MDGAVGRLFFFTHRGERLLVIGPQISGTANALREPSDIAVLPDGRLVISDTGNDRLLICSIISAER